MTPQDTRVPRPIHGPRSVGGWPFLPIACALLAGSFALGACDDQVGNGWIPEKDTVVLFSLARPELNLPSAYSFATRAPYRVEAAGASGTWDLAVDTRGGQLVMLPPGALGISSPAGIAPISGTSWLELDRAPGDTAAYIKDVPVPIEVGKVYVIQTNFVPVSFGGSCVKYAKMEAVATDVDAGTFTFYYDANPFCNDRHLIPPTK